MGESPEEWGRESAASGVMMIPIPHRGVFRHVEGLEEARAVTGIDDIRVTAKADQLLIPLPEGASYLGFIFARGDRAWRGGSRPARRAPASPLRDRSRDPRW